MNELSLHILDICENSIKADATLVTLEIIKDTSKKQLTIRVTDNGKGMDEQTLKRVTDPFYTTRTTRNVGMGISLFKMAAELTGGSLIIESKQGLGTTVTTTFMYEHIDCAPLGTIEDTIISLISQGGFDLIYTHAIDQREFQLNTIDLKEVLDGMPLTDTNIILWIKNNIKEGLSDLQK